MIYELRTYTFQPGKQGEYLKLNAEVGRKVRGDKYGKFEGGWTTEFGMLNQYVHLWAYPDLNERERLRGELAKNEEWTKGYVPQIRPLLMAQENKILSRGDRVQAAHRQRQPLRAALVPRAGRPARRVAEPRQGRAPQPREVLAQRVLLADRGRPAQRGRPPLGLQGSQRARGRAVEGAGRSRLAGVSRQGAAAAGQHAVDGAHPDAGLPDEIARMAETVAQQVVEIGYGATSAS